MSLPIEVITAQLEHTTHRLQAQSRVSRMLIQADSLNAAIADTLEILCSVFSWRFGEYWAINRESSQLQQTIQWDITTQYQFPNPAWSFQKGSGLPGQIWAAQKPIYFQDLPHNPDFLRHDFALEIGLRHGYGFPICDRTGIIGVVTFLTQTDHPLDEDLIDLLLLIGEQLGLFIQRKSNEIQLRQYADQLESTLQTLRKTQMQMIQTEKMSSLGQLVAGIAHEINNPTNFIHGNLRHAHNYQFDLLNLLDCYEQEYPNPTTKLIEKQDDIDLEFLRQDFPQILQSMRTGCDRIRMIVESLRIFSRLDEAAEKAVDLHEGLDSTLLILGSRLKAQTTSHQTIPEIQVLKKYGDLPKILCHAGQVNQIFMNVLVNAIDALEECDRRNDVTNPPKINITTERLVENWIRVTIADNGPGIPEHLQSQVFNPFFTTKPVGKGTGLGMSISYQIATEVHPGRFYFESTVNSGTCFILELPSNEQYSGHF
jgi:signal transduction histidine kinase